MSGNKNYATLMNQGYHLESDVGYYNGSLKIGPNEREEMYRAEMIEYEANQRLKHDKKRKEDIY